MGLPPNNPRHCDHSLLFIFQVIADNVGDNVGDIAGMGSDLFGSYAESTCAALFVASISSFGFTHNYAAMSYPLLISSMGIVICLITTLFATDLVEVKNVSEIEPSLKRQLLISTVLMTAGAALVSFVALPSKFTLYDFGNDKVVKNWYDIVDHESLFCPMNIGLYADYSCIHIQAPFLLCCDRIMGRTCYWIYN